MDVESLAKQLILKGMAEEQQNAVLESIKTTMGNARTVQKQRIGENVQVVVQALKKIEADIKSRYDETGKVIEKRVASIKDGRDGRDGVDGRAGKDGRPGRDGAVGPRGIDGLNGSNGIDGVDGISITDAHIDFDGSLIITLSDGKLLNVGEVVSQDIAEKIRVIQTMSTNGAVGISDEGSSISTGVKNINFVGATVTATNSGDDVTVNVSAGTGTVTSVAVSGGTTGLTTSGGPITTTGTITLGGTLAVASGGTGTATPGLIAGTNITSITGSWPNQTINAGGGSGTVTSVAATVPAFLSVTGSPITTSGTLAIGLSGSALPIANGGTGNATGTATINANLTGDVTSVGNASTLATVNSNVGSFTNANITVNAKGLITAAASGSPGGVTSVTGTSPVVSSGGTTPAISLASGYGDTLNPYASKTANFVLAAPNGSAGVPTFRAIVASDIPTLNQNTTGTAANVTGTVAVANGGTGATTAGAARTALSAAASGANSDITSLSGLTTVLSQAQGGTGTSVGYNGFKNRIINGAMVIDQRNAGASVSFSTGANVYPIDRFQGSIAQGSGHTAQQSTTVPAGFVNSVLVTIGTGASASAGNVSRLFQVVEGFNCADLDWGLATASTVTLSFWVKSSLIGTFAGGLYNSAANRNYVFTYAISAANTWEQKSITIAGDTSGTWIKNNGAGIYVNWDLGTGSTYQGTAGAWAAGVAWATSGSVKLAATSGANWSVTGVQLEKGSTATSFDYRPYGTELALCYRYYYKQKAAAQFDTFGAGLCDSTTAAQAITPFPVLMRVSPTALEQSGTATDYLLRIANTNPVCSAVPTFSVASPFSATYNFFVASGLTAGQAMFARANSTNSYLAWSAEL